MYLQIKSHSKGRGANASSIVKYILNGGSYIPRQDIQYFGNANIPEWCKDDPSDFWRLADLYEGPKWTVCREIKMALPVETTQATRILSVNKFITENLAGHALTYAIHDKKADPHVHIVFTDRKDDRIDRDPERFFRQANIKNPEKGGCAKAVEWNGPNRFKHFDKLRKSWVRILECSK